MPELQNPYIGIRPFRTEESRLFFGREKNIADLREKLSCKFLSIVGTSGSGKSSLVRAGLIPSLLKEGWFVGMFRPQGEPINNLKNSLNSEEVFGPYLSKINNDKISTESWTIADYYKQAGQVKPLVLVVDQFEEVFRFKVNKSNSKEVAIDFVNLLIDAISQDEFPIYVVITLRSDFLGRCSEFQGLTEWINKGQYLVSRLNQDQFERVIIGFKDFEEYKDVDFSQDLVSKLLNDIEDDPDQLPVLQHSLMRTWYEWERSGDPQIEIKHYLAVGEMNSSVSNHAETIFKELKYQGLENETRIIFQRITEIDYNSHKVRNPTKLSALIELNGGNSKDVIKIIDAFRAETRNFLRPDYQVELEPDTMIDVAHESLIRQWRALGKWMREEAENAREYRLINLRRENQETEGLLMNPRLAISNYWWLAENPTVEWACRYHVFDNKATRTDHKKIFSLNEKFLQESLEEQEKIDEANKTEQERKKDQQFQRVTYLTVGLVIIALILALFSRRNQILKDDAVESAQLAFIQAQQADSARLTAVNATNQALMEKSIADSLREEASLKSRELTIANTIAGNMRNQAISERELAESRTIDARIAEIGALLSESRAKVNEIEANILKLTSEYKEKIEEAKKQALVSIILDDIDIQKTRALESFEKFDQFNSMLMGLRGLTNDPDERSIDYYIQSIDSVRANLQKIITRANKWIVEIDTDLSGNYQTFVVPSPCKLSWQMAESSTLIFAEKLDSLESIKWSYDLTCNSINEIKTDREWERAYPIENHRALLEAYEASIKTNQENIDFAELSGFIEGSVDINFNLKNYPTESVPKFLSVKGIDQVAYNDGPEKIIIENGVDKVEIGLEGESIKLIKLLDQHRIAAATLRSASIFNYDDDPPAKLSLEMAEGIVNLGSSGNTILGLNTLGELIIWNDQGKIINRFQELLSDKITAFDFAQIDNSPNVIVAVGTNVGRVHLFIFNGIEFSDTNMQLNRLYAGGEPAVKNIEFSPDGHFLATSSSRQLDIWPLTAIDKSNNLRSIFTTQAIPQQISPIPMGRNESIQTSKGITGISFDKNSDFLMFINNSTIYKKPVNIYFMCQNLGSEYCNSNKVN